MTAVRLNLCVRVQWQVSLRGGAGFDVVQVIQIRVRVRVGGVVPPPVGLPPARYYRRSQLVAPLLRYRLLDYLQLELETLLRRRRPGLLCRFLRLIC